MQKGIEKIKLVWTFLRTGVTGVPIFSAKCQKPGGRPYNISPLGWDTYL